MNSNSLRLPLGAAIYEKSSLKATFPKNLRHRSNTKGSMMVILMLDKFLPISCSLAKMRRLATRRQQYRIREYRNPKKQESDFQWP